MDHDSIESTKNKKEQANILHNFEKTENKLVRRSRAERLARLSDRLRSLINLDDHTMVTLNKEDVKKSFASILPAADELLVAIDKETKELLKSQATYHAIFRSVGEGMYVIGRDMGIKLVNPAGVKLFGYETSDDLLGRSFNKVVIDDEEGIILSEKERPIYRAFMHGETYTTPANKFFLIHNVRTNEHIPVQITTNPIIMEGEIIGAVSIFHDIREIHLIDQAKSEFISFASHQLRTPLSIIGMNLELLIGHFDGTQTQDPEVVELVNEIVIAKERMNGLIDELLNVEQLELAAATSNAECFDARELIEQEMEDMQLLAQEKGISMKGIFQQQRIPFCFDRHHFRITVNNLLANAVKYSPEGKQVTIRARGNDETLVFSVKDKGFGIPKNQQDLIFGRLFRADNVRKMGIGGTGLGLYLVKRIVERQKGTIEVESEEGKGSVFTVTLPSVGENTVETGKNAS